MNKGLFSKFRRKKTFKLLSDGKCTIFIILKIKHEVKIKSDILCFKKFI